MPGPVLIIGCGYVGLPLARRLRGHGHQVDGWVRSAESAQDLAGEPLAEIIAGSVADETVWQGLTKNYEAVIHCASSGGRGEAGYEEVFGQGARMMNRHQSGARRLFISSTSVYGQNTGEVVTEESPTEPASPTSRILRRAEQEVLAAGALVLRPSGIYGPGRAVLFEKLKRGEAIIEGAGGRWINQVHRHDLVEAVAFLLQAGTPGEIYNVTDDCPVSYLDYYRWCSAFLRLPMPPHGPIHLHRKRGLTNKRVSNAKLRTLGWQPQFPSFREGLTTGQDNIYSPR